MGPSNKSALSAKSDSPRKKAKLSLASELDWIARIGGVLYLIDYVTGKGSPTYLASFVESTYGQLPGFVYLVAFVLTIVFIATRGYYGVTWIRQRWNSKPAQAWIQTKLDAPLRIEPKSQPETIAFGPMDHLIMVAMIVAVSLSFYVIGSKWEWVEAPAVNSQGFTGRGYYVLTWNNLVSLIVFLAALAGIWRNVIPDILWLLRRRRRMQ